MIEYALSFSAGLLTTLSPCVLPALPLLVGSATQEHRLGPVAMASGLVASFTLLGFVVASSALQGGTVLGLEASDIRTGAALMLVGTGLFLLSTRLQAALSAPLHALSRYSSSMISKAKFSGLAGQFALGTLLGALWAPCVGPTLGAAIGLASEPGAGGESLLRMFVFGLGTATPLLLVGGGARALFQRPTFRRISMAARPVMGTMVIFLGLAELLGGLEKAEQLLLTALPDFWVRLITSI